MYSGRVQLGRSSEESQKGLEGRWERLCSAVGYADTSDMLSYVVVVVVRSGQTGDAAPLVVVLLLLKLC